MPNPRVNPAVALSPVEGGYVAYDTASQCLYELNATGALIAELCDGGRSEAEICALAAPWIPAGQDQEIHRFLREGLDSGLLMNSEGAPAPARSLSSDELTALAEQMWRCDRTDVALQCASKAAALHPEHAGAWHMLGRVLLAVGRRDDAAAAFARYLTLCPEDATMQHQLIGLTDGKPPERASDECIRQTFMDFASHYDNKMREALGYQGPERLEELIRAEIGDATGLEILDLGCGTGLAGAAVKPHAARLTGIDLSPEMIEQARARGIYDRLETAEITEWLGREPTQFDLIAACDSMVYFGDLSMVARRAAARLKPGGWFAFTVERGAAYPLKLTDSGRYSHHPGHIRDIAAEASLAVVRLEEAFLRMEGGVEVIGLLALLRKQPHEARPSVAQKTRTILS